jgi:crotonobetainyl-CoA:carnitine CoA-transferase CaiB-like acyl-CoA transferase
VKLGSAHPRNAPYQAFRAQDGWFAMAAGNDRLWRSACEGLDRMDLFADPRFGSTALRARHQEALRDTLERECFAQCTVAELLALFARHGVPCAPINTYSQVLDDPQVRHMGFVEPLDLPNGARTRTVGSVLKSRRHRFGIRRAPPLLGEHTGEVLDELKEMRKP